MKKEKSKIISFAQLRSALNPQAIRFIVFKSSGTCLSALLSHRCPLLQAEGFRQTRVPGYRIANDLEGIRKLTVLDKNPSDVDLSPLPSLLPIIPHEPKRKPPIFGNPGSSESQFAACHSTGILESFRIFLIRVDAKGSSLGSRMENVVMTGACTGPLPSHSISC